MPTHAETFHALHHQEKILILPNAWDAGSARLIEDAGAPAIATTSAGVAWALGYPDGDALPPRTLATLVAGITAVIRLPLTVDFEGGYTNDPAKVVENLQPILDAGAVGINLEDGDGAPDLLAQKIAQARQAAQRAGVNLFINARTDIYLRDIGAPASRVGEVIARAARYRDAGADGLFVPGLTEPADIQAIVPEVHLPVNVMALPGLPAAAELQKLGIHRLSSGATIPKVLWQQTAELAKAFLATGSSDPLYENAMPYPQLQTLFATKSKDNR